VAIPGTIDNDLYGTDMSLGVASAINGIIGELHNMVEIAVGLRRIFVIEVMGAKAGYLALEAAVAFGADGLLIPERIVVLDPEADEGELESWQERVSYERTQRRLDDQLDQLSKHIQRVFAADKQYAFIIVAEGVHKATEKIVKKQGGPTEAKPYLDADYVVRKLEALILNDWGADYRLDIRKQSLGYPVRGALPCRFDLWLGAILGRAAVERLLDEKTSIMVGYQYHGRIVETAYAEVIHESDKAPGEIWSERPRWRESFELFGSLAQNLPQAESETLEYWTFADDGE
jgi:6-phosphofructokinase 1